MKNQKCSLPFESSPSRVPETIIIILEGFRVQISHLKPNDLIDHQAFQAATLFKQPNFRCVWDEKAHWSQTDMVWWWWTEWIIIIQPVQIANPLSPDHQKGPKPNWTAAYFHQAINKSLSYK